MAIRGSLTEASLPDVLMLLSMGRKTGCLELTHSSGFGYIYFQDGRISFASIINRELASEDAVYAMFTWTEGEFSFEPGIQPEPSVPRTSIDPQSVMLEGAQRVDEWSLIKKKIPSNDIVFALDRQVLLSNSQSLTPDQEELVSLIDGSRDVEQLIQQTRMGEFEVAKSLYGLITANMVLPVGRDMRAAGEARYNEMIDSFYQGVVALREGKWVAALQIFQQVTSNAAAPMSAFVNLSYAYERLHQLEDARAALSIAMARGGRKDPVVHIAAASLSLQSGDANGAAESLATARQLWGLRGPAAVWYHYAGIAAALTNDLDKAIQILEEGIRQYPGCAPLIKNLAVAYEVYGGPVPGDAERA